MHMIYLDNNATTKIDPSVLEAMMPYLTSEFGNPASNHPFGAAINQQVKKAREQVADLIHCSPMELIFTSGATESINIAIKGIAKELKNIGNHIITVATEHAAVLDTCYSLTNEGYELTILRVGINGSINLEELNAAIRPTTILISVMFVNNETGVIQPIKQIADLAHQHQIAFMSDGTQAVGKMPVDVYELGIDILAFSGHKFYGPKGVGGLFIRNKRPYKVKLQPLLHGGGHELGLRSGTLNVAGIVGLGQAATLAMAEMEKYTKNIKTLRDGLENQLLQIDRSYVNGDPDNRLYNVSNIRFKDVDADAIIAGMDEIMISNGSACSSTKTEPSHVLKAMGLSDDDCYSSIRISLGKFNNEMEIDVTVATLKTAIAKLRQMSLHTTSHS